MTDLKTLIYVIEQRISIAERNNQAFVDLPYDTVGAVLAMLKKQEHKDRMFHALEEDWKKLKEQETANLYKCPNCGTWVSAENVVRCKDCIHRGKSEKCVLAAISDEKGFPIFMLDNRGDWFCADGVNKYE